MFNIILFKQSIRKNFKLWLVLTVVLSIFSGMIAFIAKVNPNFNLPGSPISADLISIYAGAFYGMMGLILIIVYTITVGNRLVVSEVDHGDLSYTLNTPVSRIEIIFTRAIFLVTSIFMMILVFTISTSIINAVLSPNKLDYGKFWLINWCLFCFMLVISGISFAASCWFNKSGNALIVGAGLPIAFFLFDSFAKLGSEFEAFKYFTLNTLFSPNDIISGKGILVNISVLLGLSLILYTIGILKFTKKDLPL